MSEFLEHEYGELWNQHGISEPLFFPQEAKAPEIQELAPFLLVTEGPAAPDTAFVLELGIQDRVSKSEEALWERILGALSLKRNDVALVRLSLWPDFEGAPPREQPQVEPWRHFWNALPPSVTSVVFLGKKAYESAAGESAPEGWQRSEGKRWLVTYDLKRLLNDPESKKEAWNQLKDFSKGIE